MVNLIGGKRGKFTTKFITKSQRADIQFPVGRISRFLRQGKYAKRISPLASVYMASVLEYLTAEMLELAGQAAHGYKRNRINPRFLQLALLNDEELSKLLCKVTIAGGGVIPHIHPILLAYKAKRIKAGKDNGKKAEAKKRNNNRLADDSNNQRPAVADDDTQTIQFQGHCECL